MVRVRVSFSLVFVFLVTMTIIKANNVCPYVVPGFQTCENDGDCAVYGSNLECQKEVSFLPGFCGSKTRQCQYASQKCYREGNVFNCHTPVGDSCTVNSQCLGQSYCVGGLCTCNTTNYGYCTTPNGFCPPNTICIGVPPNTGSCLAFPGQYCQSSGQCSGASACVGCKCVSNNDRSTCVSYTDTNALIASYVTCVNGVIGGSHGACGSDCCPLAASVCASVIAPVRFRPTSSILTDIANDMSAQGSFAYYRACEARYNVQEKCGYRTDIW